MTFDHVVSDRLIGSTAPWPPAAWPSPPSPAAVSRGLRDASRSSSAAGGARAAAARRRRAPRGQVSAQLGHAGGSRAPATRASPRRRCSSPLAMRRAGRSPPTTSTASPGTSPTPPASSSTAGSTPSRSTSARLPPQRGSSARRSTKRTDEWGGPLDRARASPGHRRGGAQEAVAASGAGWRCSPKVNMDDGVPGGFWLDERALREAARGRRPPRRRRADRGSSLQNPIFTCSGARRRCGRWRARCRSSCARVQGARQALPAVVPVRGRRTSCPRPPVPQGGRPTLVLLGGITKRRPSTRPLAEGLRVRGHGPWPAPQARPGEQARRRGGRRVAVRALQQVHATIYRGTCVLVPEDQLPDQ